MNPVSNPAYYVTRTPVRIRWISWLPFPWRTITTVTELVVTETHTTAATHLLDAGPPYALPIITHRPA